VPEDRFCANLQRFAPNYSAFPFQNANGHDHNFGILATLARHSNYSRSTRFDLSELQKNGCESPRISLLETLLIFNAAFKKFSGDSFILDASDVDGSNRAMQERTRSMVIQIKEGARIENPRSYSPQEVEQLRQLLAAGSEAQGDLRRENFYEIEGNGEIFYIHISPISGAVVLLAKWNRQPIDCCFSSEHLVA
jgi:hypothetical protein